MNSALKLSAIFALLGTSSALATPPLSYSNECSAQLQSDIALPDIGQLSRNDALPDPFAMADGSRLTDFSQWPERRAQIIEQLYHYEIGPKPATPRDSIDAWLDGDTLNVAIHARGETLLLKSAIVYPEGNGPFPAVIGVGLPSGSLPREMFINHGVAMIPFDFTQVMSHTQNRGSEPINRLYPELTEIGAYSAWPWGISRLIDALEIVGDDARIDLSHLAVTGCSFAGKMALFAGALDERIALTIAQEPGGGGAAAWRVSETLGNVETIARTNYAWFKESMRQFAEDSVAYLPIDHHLLVSLVAPRALVVIGNTDYEWLADESAYVSCVAARNVWQAFGVPERMGYTIEGNHMHCSLPPLQQTEVQAFIDRYLLGVDVDTNLTRADMFSDTDLNKWMPWAPLSLSNNNSEK